MEINDQLAREIGTAVTHAMLKHLPYGITWVSNFKGSERDAKIAAGRAALEACREMILAEVEGKMSDLTDMRAADGQWDSGWNSALKQVRDRLKSLTQPPSKREKVEAVLKGRGDSIEAMLDKIDAIYKESE